MEDSMGIPEMQLAARNFLDQHWQIGKEFNSAGYDNDRDGEIANGDVNDDAESQRDLEDESTVEAPEVIENPVVANRIYFEAIATLASSSGWVYFYTYSHIFI